MKVREGEVMAREISAGNGCRFRDSFREKAQIVKVTAVAWLLHVSDGKGRRREGAPGRNIGGMGA